MKIAQIVPNLFQFPPNQWGAVEEIIWNYKCCLESMGHMVNLIFPYEAHDYDLVHVHMHNQAHMLFSNNIRYIFGPHDTTPLAFGKDSEIFISNKKAIKNSLISVAGNKFSIDLYDEKNKMVFLQYGVNSSFFYYKKDRDSYTKRKLLCVSKNDNKSVYFDRKGFFPALEISRTMGCFLTIAGPNKEWADSSNFNDYSYPGLIFLNEDLTKDRLREMYLNNGILLHLSSLETGQPTLAIMEALSTGMPVVATTIDKDPIPGVIFVDRNNQKEIIRAIETVFSNYDFYSVEGRRYAEKSDWKNSTIELEKIYKSVL